MTNNKNVDFYRSVTLQMTLDEMKKFQPFHKGLDLNFYDPLDDKGNNLLRKPGYNTKKINSVDVTITAKSINPDPLHEVEMREIDEELARMDSKFRVLKDHLKHTDNKRLTHANQPVETLTVHQTIVDHPYFDGENDHLKSKMRDIHSVTVPVSEIKEWESKFERKKAFYKRSKLNYVAEMDKKGEKYAIMDMGSL